MKYFQTKVSWPNHNFLKLFTDFLKRKIIYNLPYIIDACLDHSDCTGDSNVCLVGKCVCGLNGSKCSRTNPTCDHETGTCQCGKRKNKWGGPYNVCYLGQICTTNGYRGKCSDANILN